MKKNTFCLLLMSLLVASQPIRAIEKAIVLDTVPDFPDLDAMQKNLKPEIKTDYEFFGLNRFESLADTLVDFEKVEENEKIVSFRRFHPHSKVIAEEYSHFDKDTFIYVRYNQAQHRVETRGKVVPSICCKRVDSILYFEAITYNTGLRLIQVMDWSKEGFWQELVNNRSEQGEYRNNQRIGHWHIFDKSTKKRSHHQYVAGKLVSDTPDDALETHDKRLILNALQGSWYVEVPKYEIELFHLERRDSSSDLSTIRYARFRFKGEQVELIPPNYGHGSLPNSGRWTLDDKNQLRLDLKGFQNKVYQIKYLGHYNMELQLVTK